MKIAIISDLHDQVTNTRRALERIRAECREVVCCGDLCSPFMVKELGQGFQGPVHVVFGNNDGDLFRMTQVGRQFEQIRFLGEFAELELGGKRFAVNHFDSIGRALIHSPKYDVVCFGHNHQWETTQVEGRWLVNPGEIYGGLTGESGFVIYDTEVHGVTRIKL